MSQSQEPSYYEIALTGRQVLIALVILLICLVAAFFSGVWVGRDNGGSVLAALRPGAKSAAENAPPGPADKPLEEFRFFTENKAGQGKAVGSPSPSKAAGALPDASAAPPATATPPPPTTPAPKPTAAPPAAPRPTPTPKPAASPAVHAGEGAVVQVLSSRDQDQAQKVLERLIQNGYDAFMSPVEVDGQVMYRVRIGPFRDRREAEQIADRLRRELHLDTWITQ